MKFKEKMELCREFFDRLSDLLADKYEVVASCNKDLTSYLIPKGSIDKLSYYGKPEFSFRLSDHWNWYSNIKKNSVTSYVQCYTPDMPCPKKRIEEGKPSKPILGISVMFYGPDNKYHHVFGEKFDRATKTWSWEVQKPEDAIKLLESNS